MSTRGVLSALCDADPSGKGSLEPTSPRSVEACLRLGIEPSELHFMPMDVFLARFRDRELAEIACSHHETVRQVWHSTPGCPQHDAVTEVGLPASQESVLAHPNRDGPTMRPCARVGTVHGAGLSMKERQTLDCHQTRKWFLHTPTDDPVPLAQKGACIAPLPVESR